MEWNLLVNNYKISLRYLATAGGTKRQRVGVGQHNSALRSGSRGSPSRLSELSSLYVSLMTRGVCEDSRLPTTTAAGEMSWYMKLRRARA